MLGHATYKNEGGQGGGRGGGGGGFRSHKTFTFQDFDELFRQFEDENIHVFEGFNRGSPFGHQSSFVQFVSDVASFLLSSSFYYVMITYVVTLIISLLRFLYNLVVVLP